MSGWPISGEGGDAGIVPDGVHGHGDAKVAATTECWASQGYG
jgi:hypothetical protein